MSRCLLNLGVPPQSAGGRPEFSRVGPQPALAGGSPPAAGYGVVVCLDLEPPS